MDNVYELRFILSDYQKGRDITEALEQLIVVMTKEAEITKELI